VIQRVTARFVLHLPREVPHEQQAAHQSFDTQECIACPQVIEGRPLRAGCLLACPEEQAIIISETIPVLQREVYEEEEWEKLGGRQNAEETP